MLVDVKDRQAEIDEKVFRRAKRLLRFSLSRFSGVVSHVKVIFSDVNGPRGGIDKRCRMIAKLSSEGQIVMQKQGADYLEVLSYCLDRIKRAIRRKTGKRRTASIRKKRRELHQLFDQFESEQEEEYSPN